MEISTGSSNMASSASVKKGLLDLPAENLAQIVSYISRRNIFPLLTVSKQFHGLASASIYRNLKFTIHKPEAAGAPKDVSYRLTEALHTFLTSSYDYAQHVKFFTFCIGEDGHELLRRAFAAKFAAHDEASMLLNTALLVMLQKAKCLEEFNWLVPIECSSFIYQALSSIGSLHTLHVHLDVTNTFKHTFNAYSPPPPPGAAFTGVQQSLWYDATHPSTMTSSSSSVSASKTSKNRVSRSKAQGRQLGTFKGLKILALTSIDDLDCLEEIAACLKTSSSTLKKLAFSLAESLVSKTQKPPAQNPHQVAMQDDDATTEPISPPMNAAGTAHTEADVKREKQAQEQALARIFGLDKAPLSVQKQDKRVERSLKHTAKGIRLSKKNTKSIDQLGAALVEEIRISSMDSKTKSKMYELVQQIMPPPPPSHVQKKTPKSKTVAKPKSSDWWDGTGPSPVSGMHKTPGEAISFGQPSVMPGDLPLMPINSQDMNTLMEDLDYEGFSTSSFNPFGSSTSMYNDDPTKNMHIYHQQQQQYDKQLKLMSKGQGSLFQPSYAHGSYMMPPASAHKHKAVSHYHPSIGASSQPVASHYALKSTEKQIKLLDVETKIQLVLQQFHMGFITEHKLESELMSLALKLPSGVQLSSFKNLFKASIANPSYQSYAKPKKISKPIVSAVTPKQSSSESTSDSETDSESSTIQAPPKTTTTDDAATATAITDDLDTDFDMDHPDVIETDGDDLLNAEEEGEHDDEEAAADPSVLTDVPTIEDAISDVKGKGKAKAVEDDMSDPTESKLKSVSYLDIAEHPESMKEPPKIQTVEESIQNYVRMTHGLRIEELFLSFIPLKASVLAKALDLTALEKIVFHNVGSQGPFWAMIEKLVDTGTVFKFHSIYTDDVSQAFVSCLGKLPGLTNLHLMRRSEKDLMSRSTKEPATIKDLHLVGLKKHLESLQSLSITNFENEKWEIEDGLMWELSHRAKKLRELAMSVQVNTFHTFLRCLPGFRSLIAVHFITIRIPSAGSIPQPGHFNQHNEWKKHLLDIVAYFPSLKLRYIGIHVNAGHRVSTIGEKPKMSISSWYRKQEERAAMLKDGKEKGKAPVSQDGAGIATATTDASVEMDPRPQLSFSKQHRPDALADQFSIFSSMVLRGKWA